jgi:orotate phosphoribosyltransferase
LVKIDKYIEVGTKKLSSGLKSNIYYNFRNLSDEDKVELSKELETFHRRYTLVGIKTMGWELVKPYCPNCVCYDPHKNKINKKVKGPYVIVDDVISTFGTIRKCILKIGYLPNAIICIVNRMNIIEIGEKG